MSMTGDLTEAELAHLIWPQTNELMMEGAMCLWEAFLDASMQDTAPEIGCSAHRFEVMKLVEPSHVGWSLHYQAHGDMVSYDWEFIPWFLKTCAFWDGDVLTLQPNWKNLCRRGVAQDVTL